MKEIFTLIRSALTALVSLFCLFASAYFCLFTGKLDMAIYLLLFSTICYISVIDDRVKIENEILKDKIDKLAELYFKLKY